MPIQTASTAAQAAMGHSEAAPAHTAIPAKPSVMTEKSAASGTGQG